MELSVRIFWGMGIGFLVGALLSIAPQDNFLWPLLVDGIFDTGGQIFVISLRLMVVPLVFITLVYGVASLRDGASMGRISLKTLGLYLTTTAVAITFALLAATLVQPGAGAALVTDATFMPKPAPSIKEVIIGIFPPNPVQAMAEGNMLQIILFAILFGYVMSRLGSKGEQLKALFKDLNELVLKMVLVLVQFAPYGVFFLIAELFATQGFGFIGNLATYFVLMVFVLVFHAVVTYGTLLVTLARLNPLVFFAKMRTNLLFAFSTASSNATLPVTLSTVKQRLGVRGSVASFSVPLGATINMDGTAIMQGVATVFIAGAYGIDLSFGSYLMVVLTAVLASIGTAGVPGVGLIMLAMVLQQVNLPVEGIALIIGVDRLLDMTRTAVNVCGDATVSCVVARSENALDQTVFDDPAAGRA